MVHKSYTPVKSDYKYMDIIEYLFKQDGPVTGAQISRGLEMDHNSVMSHLKPAIERKWVKVTNGMYEPGIMLAAMYSAYKMGVVKTIDDAQGKMKLLEA